MLLTIENKAEAYALLTKKSGEYFKMLFDYHVDNEYAISTIHKVKHPHKNRLLKENEKSELLGAFCGFIEETTNMTYTEVANKYGRKPDKYDKAIDSEYPDEEFPIEHFSIAKEGLGSVARIHGYIRHGLFVVLRIDWGHRFHQSKH